MKFSIFLVFFLFLFTRSIYGQQLIINEISQGTAAKEYVELLVSGSSTCQTPVPCVDLRGVIVDDNDGYFSVSSSGSGIAGGAIRFANISFWSCIPQGTIIVLYNELDINPILPPNDVSMTDGNCRLVLPSNSSLLEGQSVSPSSSIPLVYPTAGWVSGGGLWAQVAMSNANDSYQIRQNASASSPLYSVSWGNNTVNSGIFFSTASNTVFSLTNGFGFNPNLQSNWSAGAVGTNETPGIGNNAANSAWIASMNPQCGVAGPTWQINLAAIHETCFGLCDGAAVSSITNGFAPFQYLWSNGDTTANLSGLCSGTYVLQVTDQNGCTQSNSITINPGINAGLPVIQSAGPFNTSDAPYAMVGLPAGGVWSSNCGSCLSVSGIFDPAISGTGIFQICYSIGTGACESSTCDSVQVILCPSQTTSEVLTICPGTSINVFGQPIGTPGFYTQVFTSSNGCDSTHEIAVQLFTLFPTDQTITICEGDSVLVGSNWITSNFYNEEVVVDNNGCFINNSITIAVEKCAVEDCFIYIPNVFTPNNDNVNDVYRIELECGFLDEGIIVNRWGELVAKFSDTNRSWDGKTIMGFPVVDGVYSYVVYYTPTGLIQQKTQGFVTVIR